MPGVPLAASSLAKASTASGCRSRTPASCNAVAASVAATTP